MRWVESLGFGKLGICNRGRKIRIIISSFRGRSLGNNIEMVSPKAIPFLLFIIKVSSLKAPPDNKFRFPIRNINFRSLSAEFLLNAVHLVLIGLFGRIPALCRHFVINIVLHAKSVV